MLQKTLTTIYRHSFSTLIDRTNHRVPLVDPQDGQKLDHHLNRYKSPIYSAYVYKRRITRDQIYPKIHIIDDVPQEEQNHLKCQTLFPIKNAMDEQTMQRLVKQDPSNINSSYVISVFCQNHFKPLIDEYVQKVLVCGKAPKNYQKMKQVQDKVLELYKSYYFGQPITQLQREIELKYLSQKQKKFISHHDIVIDGKKNDFTKCKWRQQDQRILQDMVNWRRSDPQIDDTNFRPIFQPLQLLQRQGAIQKLYHLLGYTNMRDKYNFNKQIRVYYQISQKYYNLIADKIYNRIHHYINSIQFTNLLKIPPDFMIQMAMYQIHIWLICERLLQIDTRDSRYLHSLLMDNFRNVLENKASSFNLKKENILVRNLHNMLWQNKNVLRLHFVQSNITKDNPYKGIDALVWSILFFEKVDRYGDEVYLMGQYLVKNYQMMQHYDEQDLKNGIFQFDAYNVDPKFKQIIQSINPPLSKQQFQQQFDSDKLQKKYHYNQIQKNVQTPIDTFKKQQQKVNISWAQMIAPFLRRFKKKYQTLETMDHYSQIQQQEKKQKLKQQKTIWKTKIDQIRETKEEFKDIKQIRKQIHSKRSNSSNIVKNNVQKNKNK